MPASHIFISYRRDDSAGYARAVGDALAQRFGAERVFMDVDDIRGGQPFSQVIEQALDASAVLLVLIGRRWRAERDDAPPRLHDPSDLVRREVAAGLARGMHVIPLLLDGAPMPTEAQLPEALRPLAGRNALELHHARFADDMKRLLARVAEALGEPAPAAPRRRWVVGAATAAAALGVGAAVLWWSRRGAPEADWVGEWEAQVTYEWSDTRHVERFVLRGDGGEVHGSASFLGVPRGLLEGRIDRDGIRFVTRSQEMSGGQASELVHRYRGVRAGSELRFVMQTEGGSSPRVPVSFVARRVPPR